MAEEVNSKLLEGIAYFEKMLKLMPGDRTTLEFLSVAYEQLGDRDRTRSSLIQLANTLLRENDLDAADMIASRLRGYEEEDARAAVQRVKAAHGPVPVLRAIGAPVDPNAPTTLAQTMVAAVKAEAVLVEVLAQHGIIDAAAAEFVRKQLASLPEATRPFLVSALSILAREKPSEGERAAAFVSDSASTPPIPLDSFTLNAEILSRLPENLIRVRGAVPFAKLGDTVLVATLNPMDEPLKREIERRIGGPCRLFLADPRTTEETLEKFYSESGKLN